MDEQVVNAIFEVLNSDKFATWYNTGSFDQWITGEWQPGEELFKTESQVKAELKEMIESRLK